ncbi:hypothetical protein MSAN_02439500 [Mycena sanguinolenta]|uniref:Uncharacterized protein n=1 Tax=Mycena sanguinolenta TaxID=230812 RepID=A0A8H6WYW1_9AGAR|nr:hypothetical protein MSAN_02439500 [Mycena sanguinolenta]
MTKCSKNNAALTSTFSFARRRVASVSAPGRSSALPARVDSTASSHTCRLSTRQHAPLSDTARRPTTPPASPSRSRQAKPPRCIPCPDAKVSSWPSRWPTAPPWPLLSEPPVVALHSPLCDTTYSTRHPRSAHPSSPNLPLLVRLASPPSRRAFVALRRRVYATHTASYIPVSGELKASHRIERVPRARESLDTSSTLCRRLTSAVQRWCY